MFHDIFNIATQLQTVKKLTTNFVKYMGASQSQDDYTSKSSTCVPGSGARNSAKHESFSIVCARKLVLTVNC